LALAAYVAYLINAAQFVWKLRVARYEGVEEESLSSDKPNIHGGMAT
jgi:3-vinyl bacteriochlorophyllide hydratase